MSEEREASVSRRGLMLVLSSPSGAGKTTISRRLLEGDPRLHLSVSMTTRPARPGEREGVDYYFVDHTRFAAARDDGDLLEWAQVFGNAYGTPRSAVEERLARGDDVLFDIDWQGARQLREKGGKDVVSVFILPPSVKALEERLHQRAQDSAEVVAKRMARAADEISHWEEYDYVIVNREVDESVAAARAILASERVKRVRQPGLANFVTGLVAGL